MARRIEKFRALQIDEDLTFLVERLKRLEQRNRALFTLAVLVSVVGLAIVPFAWADREPNTLDAERLRIRDANGKTRVLLETAENGDPYMRFDDEDGVTRAILSLTGTAVTLAFGSVTEPGIILASNDRASVLSLRVGTSAMGLLLAEDRGVFSVEKDGQTRIELEATAETRHLRLLDESGVPKVLIADLDGFGTIQVQGKDGTGGEFGMRPGVFRGDMPGLRLFGAGGKEQITLSLVESTPLLNLTNWDDESVFRREGDLGMRLRPE